MPNYQLQAFLVTLFCCLPTGIVAIIYASQVNSRLAMGDYAGALQASKNALTWIWVSFGIWLALMIFAACFALGVLVSVH